MICDLNEHCILTVNLGPRHSFVPGDCTRGLIVCDCKIGGVVCFVCLSKSVPDYTFNIQMLYTS